MENLAYLESIEVKQDGFSIDSDQKAEWAIRLIKEEGKEAQRLIALCDAQIDFYTQRIKQTKDKLDSGTSFLKSQLSNYFETLPKKATKTQEKVIFPSGELIRKFAKLDFVKDDKMLTEKLKGTDYVELVPKLKWAELKKDLEMHGDIAVNKATGEIVEGISIVEKPATFEIK